jgi:hypothetical protein
MGSSLACSTDENSQLVPLQQCLPSYLGRFTSRTRLTNMCSMLVSAWVGTAGTMCLKRCQCNIGCFSWGPGPQGWFCGCSCMMLLQLVNWLGEVTGDATAAGFTCKGTEAQALRECRTATEAGRWQELGPAACRQWHVLCNCGMMTCMTPQQ